MDPFISYILLSNIKRDREIFQDKDNHSLPYKSETNIRISCTRCGQNSYWCQCPDTEKKYFQETNANSQLLPTPL